MPEVTVTSQEELNALLASGKVKSVSLEAVVTRANGDVEDHGTIAFWHQSWRRRLAYRLRGGRGKVTVPGVTS